MNVSKPSRLQKPLSNLNKINKRKRLKTHSRNFNKQYFSSWDYVVLHNRNSQVTYSFEGLKFSTLLLTIIVIYICSTYFLDQILSMFFYDIWGNINSILSEHQSFLNLHTTDENNLIVYLDGLSREPRLKRRFYDTFSIVKILNFITIS